MRARGTRDPHGVGIRGKGGERDKGGLAGTRGLGAIIMNYEL